MSLKARSTMHFVFKCVHNNAPDLFKEDFVKSSDNYSVYTATAKKGCYYFGAHVFNNLPSYLKEIKSLLI